MLNHTLHGQPYYCLLFKWLTLGSKGPFTLAIFAAISSAISSSDGCERVDEL
jgi:hypothetical protein